MNKIQIVRLCNYSYHVTHAFHYCIIKIMSIWTEKRNGSFHSDINYAVERLYYVPYEYILLYTRIRYSARTIIKKKHFTKGKFDVKKHGKVAKVDVILRV